ncbi:MAG TPA: FAD-binding oxidoreductase [Kineosporiaceae bacterium]|nr:FAD-binding oxidoreductase [Kineosporiaceae bacterium]
MGAPVGDLANLLAAGSVSTAPEDLLERSQDLWTLSLLRQARGDLREPPAAVVFPGCTQDVATVLAWAEQTGTPVVPRGGGSGVCGGVDAGRGWLVLDLSRMDRILALDEESQVVHVQAGVRGARLEEYLSEHELTLGHYPQSIALSTVGGWIGTASVGQASTGYGGIADRVLGVTAVLSGGRVLHLRPTPRSAAGPDLRRLLVGSEGTFAVVTEVHLACTARPPGFEWESFQFRSFDRCIAGLRAVSRAGAGMAVLRGYDETDSSLTFPGSGYPGGCLAIAGFAADLVGLEVRREAVRERASAAGGVYLGPDHGAHWWQHRNDSAGLYRQIMGPERVLGQGVVVDSMEVAGLWSGLPDLYGAVRGAITAHADTVACHVSHVYGSGASLYFTLLLRGADDHDVESTYVDAWQAAVRGCLAAGGTMTHHHGVGRLKARFMAEELGEEGLATLRRLQWAMDPHRVLNPGALVP